MQLLVKIPHWENIQQVKIQEKLTLLPVSNITFNCLNNALESCPRSIWCNIWIPAFWAGRLQRAYSSNTPYRPTTPLCAIATRNIICPPSFTNCRNSIQSLCMQIVWPNMIKMDNGSANGTTATWITWLKVYWRFDVNKQQWVLMMLNNKINWAIIKSSRVWNGPLRTDIIAFSWREPIVQNLVIKGEKLWFKVLVVIAQLGSLG